MISAIFNIGFGTCGFTQERRYRRTDRDRWVSPKPKRNLCERICFYVFCAPPAFIFWKGPVWTILKTRYAKRYTFKFWRGHKTSSTDSELKVFNEKHKPQTKSAELLCRLLGEDVIKKRIASDLHYIDIVNLNLTCKTVHRSLIATGRGSEIYEELRIQSCDQGSKVTCWTCVNQVCKV